MAPVGAGRTCTAVLSRRIRRCTASVGRWRFFASCDSSSPRRWRAPCAWHIDLMARRRRGVWQRSALHPVTPVFNGPASRRRRCPCLEPDGLRSASSSCRLRRGDAPARFGADRGRRAWPTAPAGELRGRSWVSATGFLEALDGDGVSYVSPISAAITGDRREHARPREGSAIPSVITVQEMWRSARRTARRRAVRRRRSWWACRVRDPGLAGAVHNVARGGFPVLISRRLPSPRRELKGSRNELSSGSGRFDSASLVRAT